jgi:hypothetical protein
MQDLPDRYPGRIAPNWRGGLRRSVGAILQENWDSIVGAALVSPDAFARLDHSLGTLSLAHLRSKLQSAVEERLRLLRERGLFIDVRMLENGSLLFVPGKSTEAEVGDATFRCLAASSDWAILYSKWPLPIGNPEGGAATLELSILASAQSFQVTGDEGEEEIRVPVSASAYLSLNGKEERMATHEIVLKNPATAILPDADAVPWPVKDLYEKRKENAVLLLSELCDKLQSKSTVSGLPLP